jgi:integrase
MKSRTASLQVAHQTGCANKTRTGLDSLACCSCRPSYFTLYRDLQGVKVKGDNGEGRIVGRTRKRREAERWLAKLQERLDEGHSHPNRLKSIAFAEWVAEYQTILAARVARGELAASTERGYAETLRIASDAIGHVDVRALGQVDFRRFNEAVGDVKPATRARRFRELGACLTAARDEGYAEADALRVFRRSELRGLSKLVPKRGTDPYTDDELRLLWAAMRDTSDPRKAVSPVYLALCRVAVATGARVGELIALEWQDVNLTETSLTIRHTFDGTIGKLTPPKDREIRSLTLTPAAMQVFGEWVAHVGVQTAGPVFVGPHGERLNGDYVWRVVERARKAAGVPKLGETGLHRTVHSFRDTFTRQALERGANPEWIRAQLGHSTLDLTLNVYGQWSQEALRAEAEKVTADT